MLRKLTALTLTAALVAGCGSQEVIEEQGWIGGEYATIPAGAEFGLPDWLLRPEDDRLPAGATACECQDSGVLVTQVFAGTPSQAAGLREGDVVVSVNGEPVESAGDFLGRIENAAPGSTARLEVFRFGERVPAEVVVGREQFDRKGRLALGLHLSSKCDLLPDPDFNLLGMLAFQRGAARAERLSARNLVRRHNRETADAEAFRLDTPDSWSVTLLLVSVAGYRTILDQEVVAPLALSTDPVQNPSG